MEIFFVGFCRLSFYSSSDFVSSEGKMVECLDRSDKVMEKKNYAEAAREMCKNVRLEDLSKYKGMIKREGNKVEVLKEKKTKQKGL